MSQNINQKPLATLVQHINLILLTPATHRVCINYVHSFHIRPELLATSTTERLTASFNNLCHLHSAAQARPPVDVFERGYKPPHPNPAAAARADSNGAVQPSTVCINYTGIILMQRARC